MNARWHLARNRNKLSNSGFWKNRAANPMFNPTLIVIEAFIRELRTMYERTYGILEPNYPGILNFAAQLALENIATSDAAYHDVDHTIMVTLVGRKFCAAGILASVA